MVRLVLMFTAAIIDFVYGIPPYLPPLPTKADGCYEVSSEFEMFRVEGDAVILTFSNFERALQLRKIALPKGEFIITKDSGTEAVANQQEGRVLQIDKQLWLLPAKASDSGEYICSYRNETYCVTGTIKLQVYEPSSVDMDKLSYLFPVTLGQRRTIFCPWLDDFNKTDGMIRWDKDSRSTGRQQDDGGSFSWANGKLLIPVVKRSHAGVYICRLQVRINNRQYNVSRAILLKVESFDAEDTPTPTVDDHTMTSHAGPTTSGRTTHAPNIQPPAIVSPLNGTVFESLHGSALELFCTALTKCEMANSTVVTWLVDGQSVESRYPNARALQWPPRVTRLSEDHCQIEVTLILSAVTEEEVKTELKCVAQNRGGKQEVVAQLRLEDSTFTWLVVAVVAASCFLTVVSIFLYVLFKPKKKRKMDYILARQSSVFSE